MKLLKRTDRLEVKRTFVISDYGKTHTLKEAEKKFLPYSEEQLDAIIRGKKKDRWTKWRERRIKIYNRLDWHIGTARINELGVWKKAGGLPLEWTRGSLQETALAVRTALQKKPSPLKYRSRTAIPGILKANRGQFQKEKYLLPIILPGGTWARKRLKRMAGEVDDGCMRSVALAVSGKKVIKAYIGVPKKKHRVK